MSSSFFIDRPIFAWVIALFIVVLGGAAITRLPVAQYPTGAPPTVVISTASPGASAPDGQGPWLVRNFLRREPDGAGLFVGEMLRQGRRVRLHVRDRVTSAEDLDRTLRRCADRSGTACAGALLFSCLGRGMGLYGVPDHDTRAFQTRFPDVALGGFFCSGEIGPVGGTTYLHGFTSSFGLFLPREAADGDGGPAPR